MTIFLTDMKAFYASLKSPEETSPSHVISYRPSEKTKKAILILQDLFSKDFSLLFHPGLSIEMKDTLGYLSTVAQEEGFSMTTKLEIQNLLRCFNRWCLEYCNAGLSATTDLSKASAVMNDLEANVKEFEIFDNEETCLYNQLVCLEEEKRKLEEKIKIINVQIENSRARIDKVAKRKKQLFEKGKVLKFNWNILRIRVPRLKAEQELAQRIRDNIEAEWLKVREQFIRSTSFKDWIGNNVA